VNDSDARVSTCCVLKSNRGVSEICCKEEEQDASNLRDVGRESLSLLHKRCLGMRFYVLICLCLTSSTHPYARIRELDGTMLARSCLRTSSDILQEK
jgi:hypothetical protein